MELDSELVRLVTRIGYTAAWNGLFGESLAIFQGVSGMRPNSEVPLIGLAVAGILSGNEELAKESLDKALDINPESDLARVYLACLMRVQGNEEEGSAILNEISTSSKDEDAKAMAAHLKELPAEEILAPAQES